MRSLINHKPEILLFTLLLGALNVPLVTGEFSAHFILLPEEVAWGQWWRLLTFVWVHISPYHLALNAIAFLFLYAQLRARLATRLQHLFCSSLLSGLVPLWLDERITTIGLCGLSGVAHGLLAIVALEMAQQQDRHRRMTSLFLFGALLIKTVVEQLSGRGLFGETHLGHGTTIVACHLGGVLGALLSFAISGFSPASSATSPGSRPGRKDGCSVPNPAETPGS